MKNFIKYGIKSWLLSWLMICVVGAYVQYKNNDGDWTGYLSAMAIMLLGFPIYCLFIGAMKLCVLIPVLLLQGLFTGGKALKNWWLVYGNSNDLCQLMYLTGGLYLFIAPDDNKVQAVLNGQKYKEHTEEILRRYKKKNK